MATNFRHILSAVAVLVLMAGTAQEGYAQKWRKNKKEKNTEQVTVQQVRPDLENRQEFLPFFVEGTDTIYYDEITASKIYSRLPKQKGREWRQYYRLVHNFSKAYPYALVAKKLVHEADSTIAADKLKGAKRDKYVTKVQNELFDVFEGQMRKLTVSQGALIMKLVDREVGKSSYNIIKGYKSGIAAGFWQGIAKIFGSDLKNQYDRFGEDKMIEELVQMYHNGQFQYLYFSIFGGWHVTPSKSR